MVKILFTHEFQPRHRDAMDGLKVGPLAVWFHQSFGKSGAGRCRWRADSEAHTYAPGARPENSKNEAISEWPTDENGKRGRADYVLFLGLRLVAVVEAKKENTNVSGKISQAVNGH